MTEAEMSATFESKESLASSFSRYSDDKDRFDKAVEAAFSGSVKKHVFLPSGRVIWTVVGRNGDEFVEPSSAFCSCESHFYRVMSGKTQQCYHIMGYRIAEEANLISEITLDDEEYDTFMRLLASDLLTRGS